jgi:hypothetical protein
MLNQSGLHIRWRDMSRTTEAIRQLVHHPYVKAKPALEAELLQYYYAINGYIRKLMLSIQAAGTQMPEALAAAARATATAEGQPAVACLVDAWDRPKPPADDDLCCIYSIEENYASFCTSLLNSVLVPHWDQVRTGLVEDCNVPFKDEAKAEESEEPEEAPKLPGPGEVAQAAETTEAGKIQQAAAVEQLEKPTECDPGFLHLAEELIVFRYIALIRAVLVNMRYLALFVSTAFVLALVAWNSYPFQPHRLVDWCFTVMLIIIGTGIVWVFAQMHRNSILSRITDTTPNKLGVDFFIRIATFGAVPVLTWLAYQFPEIGGSLFKIFQPGLQVLK